MNKKTLDPFRHFDAGFPLEMFNLINEEIGMTLSKCGGVNVISYMDVLDFKGKKYPERTKFRILTNRRGGPMGRPLMSPAIRFFMQDGECDKLISPTRFDALPNAIEGYVDLDGVKLTERFMLGELSGGFHFKASSPAKSSVLMTLSRYHVNFGEESALKNQCACVRNQWGIHWLPADMRDKDFDINDPFPDADKCKQYISEPKCRIKGDELILHSTVTYSYGKKELYTVFAAPGGKWEIMEDRWYVRVPYAKGGAVSFSFGCGDTLARAEHRARLLAEDFDNQYRANVQRARKLLAAVPHYEMPGLPSAEEFLQVAPVYQYSLLVARSKKEAAIQASANNFGYFALWDHIYPIRDFMMAGDKETARQLLTYMLDYPHVRYAIWASMQMVLAINENQYFDPDPAFLRSCWPVLCDWFKFALTLADKKTGLLKFTCSMGCDNPAEMGLLPGKLNFASCMNGWWYSTCRVMENMAIRMDDKKMAKAAADTGAKARINFIKVFYNEKDGYLYSAVNINYTRPTRRIYVNTSSVAFDYPFGRDLLRNVTLPMARYQKTKFYLPTGRNTTSWDSEIGCEMWKNVHMNQHTGHECKLARFAGDGAEAFRFMKAYLNWYKKYGTAIETFNYSGCDGDVYELSDWQAFSVTGAITGLTQGVIGLSWHCGGLCYTPAEDDREYTVDRFPAFGHRVDVAVSGTGAAAELVCDGKTVKGTLQVPAEYMKTCKKVKFIRKKTFAGPTLLLAIDLPVENLSAGRKKLSFTAGENGHCPILCNVGSHACRVSVNGKKQSFEYSKETGNIWFDPILCQGDVIEVETL